MIAAGLEKLRSKSSRKWRRAAAGISSASSSSVSDGPGWSDVQVDHLEIANGLALAAVVDLEVVGRQAAHGLAVAADDVDRNLDLGDVGPAFEGALLGQGRTVEGRQGQEEQERKGRTERSGHGRRREERGSTSGAS